MSHWTLYVTLPDGATPTSGHADLALRIALSYVRSATVTAEGYGGSDGPMAVIQASGCASDIDNAVYALERWSGQLVELDELRRWRRYRMSDRIWGLGFQRDPGGWHVTVGRWVWTTEVESG